MYQRRKLTNIVPYFHICLNLMNVYMDIKDKILANIRVIANNLFFVLKLCKQFILAFQALQTIFFQISHPPLQKNNGSSLIYAENTLTLSVPVSLGCKWGRWGAKMCPRPITPKRLNIFRLNLVD